MRATAIYAVLIALSYAASDFVLHPWFGTEPQTGWMTATVFSVMGFGWAKIWDALGAFE